jgi:hypothetical protein
MWTQNNASCLTSRTVHLHPSWLHNSDAPCHAPHGLQWQRMQDDVERVTRHSFSWNIQTGARHGLLEGTRDVTSSCTWEELEDSKLNVGWQFSCNEMFLSRLVQVLLFQLMQHRAPSLQIQILNAHKQLMVLEQRLDEGLHAPPPIMPLVCWVIDGLFCRGPCVIMRRERQPVLQNKDLRMEPAVLTHQHIETQRGFAKP